MASERRRLGRTHARNTVQQIIAPREQQRAARFYAELWYSALLVWKVEYSRVLVPKVTYDIFPDRWGYISTMGEVQPDQRTMVALPNGQHLEGEVAQIISGMALSNTYETRECGRLLDLLRRPESRKPATLLRESGGWQPDASRHAAWALAVLSLGVTLKDEQAEQHLAYCRQVMLAYDLSAANV